MDETEGLGKETVFDFRYIPAPKRRTRLGDRRKYFFKKPGVEILSYLGLFSASAVAAGLSTALYFVVTRAFPETRSVFHGLIEALRQRLAIAPVGTLRAPDLVKSLCGELPL